MYIVQTLRVVYYFLLLIAQRTCFKINEDVWADLYPGPEEDGEGDEGKPDEEQVQTQGRVQINHQASDSDLRKTLIPKERLNKNTFRTCPQT